jgi:DNA-binding HxlR family transcriptional regulator
VENESYHCGVTLTLEMVGGKWKGVILWHLLHKTLRFSQLQRRIPKVTQKMLTQQLRELERDDLIHRKVFAEVPPRVEYTLTSKGKSLSEILTLMCEWGKENISEFKVEDGVP